MPDYKLSAQLKGHDADVRCVAFPSPDVVLSSSRDHTVRVWRKTSAKPPSFEASITTQGHDFINSIAFIRPSPSYPDGLIISGGKEAIIEARTPAAKPEDNAERLLIGHANNICALDVSPKGSWIVSGAWDGQARVWNVGKWQTELVLQHESGGLAVWAVMAYDDQTVITGCADKKIRIFDLRQSSEGEVQPRATISTPDVVRALTKLPTGIKGHPTGADFASASNDGVIRLWRMNGQQVAELHGHESFVYSLATLPTSEIVSAGEDRTLRVWWGTECVQTITHPAISVWTVAVNEENGDIASGASDNVVRVFSRNPERVADAESISQFEESVKSSAIPQQSLGAQINKETLDTPPWLQTHAGTKEGQVKMIREDNESISAYTWSMGSQTWVNVGTVVDSAGSSGRKVEYQGKEYDYVFDVDIEDGKPPLKLPYNLSENNFERATKFLNDNNLPLTYLDSVANFITENTKSASIGQSSGGPAPDPYGTESRYRPGDESRTAAKKHVPHTEYITLTQGKFEPIQKKILSLNSNLMTSGNKHVALNPSETNILEELISSLNAASSGQKLTIEEGGVQLVLKLVTDWPYSDRLPGLDLLRCIVVSPAVASLRHPKHGNIAQIAPNASLQTDGAINENSVMMALRAITNLFATKEGTELATQQAENIFKSLAIITGLTEGTQPIGARNRNLQIALTSALFNYSILAYGKKVDLEAATWLLQVIGKVLEDQEDAEVVYRALMALGNVVAGDFGPHAKALGAAGSVHAAKATEERVREVKAECMAFLR